MLEQVVSPLLDHSGNQNHGTIIGASWSSDNPLLYDGPAWHISTSGSDDNDGSEDSPFCYYTEGIDAASDGDTVMVLPGTYYEQINYGGKSVLLKSTEGVKR